VQPACAWSLLDLVDTKGGPQSSLLSQSTAGPQAITVPHPTTEPQATPEPQATADPEATTDSDDLEATAYAAETPNGRHHRRLRHVGRHRDRAPADTRAAVTATSTSPAASTEATSATSAATSAATSTATSAPSAATNFLPPQATLQLVYTTETGG